MIWADYVNYVAALLDVSATITNAASANPSSVGDFNTALPASISETELRIQRDLDLQNTLITDETASLTASTRQFTLPTDSGQFVVTEQVYLIVSGVRQPPLLPISYEALNAMYPSDAPLSPTPSYPVYWAPRNQISITVGPAPDSTYGIGVVGTQRYTPLSSTNTSNFLTLYYPDLYLAAALCFWSRYERNWGSAPEAPMSGSWEMDYQNLLKGALPEEARKRLASQGWTPRLPNPIATPPQT